jgi:hypothetical protein
MCVLQCAYLLSTLWQFGTMLLETRAVLPSIIVMIQILAENKCRNINNHYFVAEGLHVNHFILFGTSHVRIDQTRFYFFICNEEN